MFDHKTMTYNGTAVAYAALPMYMISEINKHESLTPAAKQVFMLLMSYASSVNSCQFKITHKWIEERTALSDKTVSRALVQLREHGYVNDTGIVYGVPPANQLRATATTARPSVAQQKIQVSKNATDGVQITQPVTTPVPSVQVHHFPDVKKMVETKQDQSTDLNAEVNAMFASLGIRKKVVIAEKPAQKTADILSNESGHFDSESEKMSAPIITIPNNTLLKNTPTASAEKVAAKKPTEQNEPSGLFSSTSSSGVVGFVEKSKPKPLASFLPTLGKGATVAIGKQTGSLSQQHESYIRSALTRMNVTSPSERQRYTAEIAYAATQGAFSETYRHTPLKAIRACLNLVEAGKWRANAGMY